MDVLGKVLLVEDSEITKSIVETALEEVCELQCATNLEEAKILLCSNSFKLILLDVKLPDGDGFQFYSEIRQLENHRRTPVLFLTASGQIEDKKRGFSLGADDYIVKPFDPIEFKSRITAKLKNLSVDIESGEYAAGPLKINLGSQRVEIRLGSNSSKALQLTANQIKVLAYISKRPNAVISREQLLHDLWGSDVHVTGRTIDTHIYAIRRELGEYANLIQSVHGKGYSFNPKATSNPKAA